ncbi:MAG: hypothetical protein KDC46_00725 [Thermoleophilia bacterium]|nr:hypothetical protein [Thermoleophilia bacterium]
MIQIARVDYPNMPPDLRRLLIERAHGVAGVHGRVTIEPTDPDGQLDQVLQASIEVDASQDPQVVMLDAALAEHVIAAVSRLVEDPEAQHEQAGSPWAWSVELDWGGHVTHVEVHGAPSDEALHGVLEAATRLLDGRGIEPA